MVSEATWWLLTPSTLLLLLMLFAYVSARARAGRLAAALLFLPLLTLLALFILPIDEYVANPLENRLGPPDPLPTHVDGVLVLGGAVDWRETADRQQLSLDAAGERLLAALALAHRYPQAELVFTGLFDDALRQEWRSAEGDGLLFAPALTDRDVLFLGEARSTYEEALYATERVRPAPGSTWLLVTSALHMPRAHETFKAQGWTLLPFPVDYRTTTRVSARFDVKVGERLAGLDRAVREWGAYLIYRWLGRI